MRDPHVEAMIYEVSSGEGISYRDPEPISFSNHLGAFNLSDGKLRIIPAEHFANEDNARQVIEPFLQAWEIKADLTSNIGMIRFKFVHAEIIDRNPPPPGSSQIVNVKAAGMVSLGGSVSVHLISSKYPTPPETFRTTPEVSHAHRRWLGYRQGKEPLQAMAYFVLTLLETGAGGRQNAAHLFNIDIEVLKTIGRLSSTKGDEKTARKASAMYEELTGPEKTWLEEATRLLIYRLGEHASGVPLSRISFGDLPDL